MTARGLAACAVGLLFAVGVRAAPAPCDPPSGVGAATARTFMVAAAHPRAVAAGCRVLAAGGAAADAAVAVQMVLAVVEPHASGLAGGTLAIHFDAADGAMHVYDGLAAAPAGAGTDLRAPLDPGEAARCGVARFPGAVTASLRAVGVPGTLAALERLHREHGALPWARLFDEAILAARDGFALSPYLAATLSEPVFGTHRCAWPDVARRYCENAATPKPVGARLTNPEAARTLERVRDGGAAALVEVLARDLERTDTRSCSVEAVPPDLPSTITREDLAGYRAVVREPLCLEVLEHRVCTAPPPSYGGFVLLRVLDFMQRAGAGGYAPESVDHVHRHLQASHLAQMTRRALIGDPGFSTVDVAAALSPAALSRAFARVSPDAAVAFTPPADAGTGSDRTTHVSIVDARGNALAMTATNGRSFGVHREAAGFVLNNALGNFTSPRAKAGGRRVNAMGPGRRPRTAMSPTLVFDAAGRLRLVVGSAGGAAIPDHVAQAVLAVLVHGRDARGALTLGHVSGQRVATRGGTALRAELEADTAVARHREALEALGYAAVSVGRLRSGLALIRVREDGVLEGAADPRRDGIAVGR